MNSMARAREAELPLPDSELADAELLAADGVWVTYGGRTVLDLQHMGVRRGELLAVLGPNGAGKSTLLRVLAMLERPAAGRIVFRGRAGRAAENALRRHAAVVFQRTHLWAGTVAYNVGLGLGLRGVAASQVVPRVRAACDALGIPHLVDRESSELSGGEVQRVALARALVLEPELLFLDEPTANLDSEVREALRTDLARVARRGRRATLLITHDRAEAFYLADRIAVLEEGRLVQIGTPAELYENPADPYVAAVTGAELALPGRVVGREGALLRVDAAGADLLALGSAEPGSEVRLAYRPEDLVLATGPRESSARNRFEATVIEMRPQGGLVRVRLEGPPEVVALITRTSADNMELRPGARVTVHVKATALHAFAS